MGYIPVPPIKTAEDLKKINHEGAQRIQQARILPAFFDFRAFAEVVPGAEFLDKNLSNGVR
jgi:hypothetical protein